MSNSYTGVRVIEVRPDLVDRLYQDRFIETSFNRSYKFHQNQYIVVKDNSGTNKSAITRCIKDKLWVLRQPKDLTVSGVRPKNKEQWMAFDALLDNCIKVVVLTGKAGTGKTLLTLASALHLVERKDNTYERIILTRPMSWVGRHGLGALPGDVDDKFGPYLENYMCNISYLMNGKRRSTQDLIRQYSMDFIPLQLIRGASWMNTIVIADEVQVLGYDEMVALGTRLGEGSKLVVMGDLGQRDEKIAREKTGIHKFINDARVKANPIAASIDLIKCERSEIASLFADVFER
jgi:PhoH-like ATPase